MKARDVMTTEVISVGPEATVSEIASLLYKHRISGVPVVEKDRVIGIVSEGDLIRRNELKTDERNRSWWLQIFGNYDLTDEYVRSHGRRAADIMTPDPVTVDEDTPLSKIADIFETRRIKRVPVVHDGRLVGIVSRANLVQALAGLIPTPELLESTDDSTIKRRLDTELKNQPWWSGFTSNVMARDGVVHFWGFYRSESERTAARIAAENIPGVKRVIDHRVRYHDYAALD
jgi:CBS domain-containing protein